MMSCRGRRKHCSGIRRRVMPASPRDRRLVTVVVPLRELLEALAIGEFCERTPQSFSLSRVCGLACLQLSADESTTMKHGGTAG